MSDEENEAQSPGADGERYQRVRLSKPDAEYRCRNIDDITSGLRWHITNHSSDFIPQTLCCQFVLGPDAILPISVFDGDDVPPLPQSFVDGATLDQYQSTISLINVSDALADREDSKEQMKFQRKVAKSIMGAIERADGYSYLERKSWYTKKNNGSGFKFICRDSLQNRGRVASGGRRGEKRKAAAMNGNHSHEEVASEPHALALPTFDCGGIAMVRFSAKDHLVTAHYFHNPIHSKVSERPPPPAPAQQPVAEEPAAPVKIKKSKIKSSKSKSTRANGENPEKPPKPKKKRRKKQTDQNADDEDDNSLQNLVDRLVAEQDTSNVPYYSYPTNTNGLVLPGAPSVARKPKQSAVPAASPAKSKRSKQQVAKSKSAPTITQGGTTKRGRSAKSAAPEPEPVTEKRKRKGHACLTCKSSRTKCDGHPPVCNCCQKRGKYCEWEEEQTELPTQTYDAPVYYSGTFTGWSDHYQGAQIFQR